MQMPSRTESESLGADSLEAEAETEAVENTDAAEDARIAASATAMVGSGTSAGQPGDHAREEES
jgi:branched-chain amino acid transport system permease protein